MDKKDLDNAKKLRQERQEAAKAIKDANAEARKLRREYDEMKKSGTATTEQLKKQAIELRKKNTIASDLIKKRREETKDVKETTDLISESEKIHNKLAEKVSKMSQGSQDFLDNQVGIESLTGKIAKNHERAQNYSERTSEKAKATSAFYNDIGDALNDSLTGLVDLEGTTADLGTAQFESGAAAISQREQEAEALRRSYEEKLAAGELDNRSHDVLLRQIELLEALNKVERERVTLLGEIDDISKKSAESIMGPLNNIKTFVDGMPFGPLISRIAELDPLMENFSESVSSNIAQAMDPKSTMDYGTAFQNIMDSSVGVVNGLAGAVGKVNAMMGGMLAPILAVVGILFLAKKAIDMFFGGTMETRKELGVTTMEAAKLQNITNTAAMQFKMLGVSAEDVAGITKGIQDNLGGVSQVTQETVTALASLNANFGVSGETATKLMATMQAVGSASSEAAISQLESVGHLARQNGVAPAAIIEDMASDMDTFASFAVDGGKNLAKAAISARKLGLDMATTAKMAESLLSFEDSINAQMEASMLTGRMINTDKARELALAGDLDGMQREITSQIGSAAEFESMNVIQRQKLAAAFGVSVGELSKMITNQDKLNNMTDSEKKKRDLIAGAMEELGKAGTQLLSALKSMIPVLIGVLSPLILIASVVGGVLVLFGKLLEFLNQANVAGIGLGDVLMFAAGAALLFKKNLLSGMMSGIKNIIGGIGKMGSGLMSKVSGGGGAGGAAGGVMDKITGGDKGKKGGSPLGFVEKIDPKKMLAGAAAMLIVSAALFVTAKALQEFAEVSFGDLGKAGLALLGLVGVLAAVGAIMMSGVGAVAIIAGAAAMLVIASSLLVLGIAIQAIGKGFDILASGLTKIFPVMSQLVSIGTSIMALGAAFGVLAVGLGAFAVAAMALLPALPVLMVLGGMALGAGMLLGGGGGAQEENNVEIELKKQNEKLDTMISLLSEDGPIAENTKKGAQAGEGFIKSVIMA